MRRSRDAAVRSGAIPRRSVECDALLDPQARAALGQPAASQTIPVRFKTADKICHIPVMDEYVTSNNPLY